MIRTGTASWAAPSTLATAWYPAAVRSSSEGRLRHYAGIFDAVEVDATHHALATPASAARWVERTPAGFAFGIKAYSPFTGHALDTTRLPKELRAQLGDAPRYLPARGIPEALLEKAWRRSLTSAAVVREAGKLGYLLFQLPPRIGPSERSFAYLRELARRTREYRVAVEFRNDAWYDAWPRVRELLTALGLVHVVVDAAAVAGAPPRVLEATTADLAVMRCSGRSEAEWRRRRGVAVDQFSYRYGEAELRELLEAAADLTRQAEEVFVIFNNAYLDIGHRNAEAFADLAEREAFVTRGLR